MTTLVTDQKFKFGTENIIPFAGKVKISSIGEIEVEDHLAQNIININCGFYLPLNDESTTTTTTTEPFIPTLQQDEIGQEQSQDLGKEELDELGIQEDQDPIQINTELDQNVAREALEANTLAELKEAAKPFPSAEWRTLGKADLITYLLSKIA